MGATMARRRMKQANIVRAEAAKLALAKQQEIANLTQQNQDNSDLESELLALEEQEREEAAAKEKAEQEAAEAKRLEEEKAAAAAKALQNKMTGKGKGSNK